MQISEALQNSYDAQYSDQMTEWRELGGRYKAENILAVCEGHQFPRVLECGAGEGSILKTLSESSRFDEFCAVEISDSAIAQIHKRSLKKLKEVRKFDGYELPYRDKSFDLAYCSHVIEHVEHPRLLLRELKRVSTYQAFEVPLDYRVNVDRNIDHLLSYGHINIFTPSTFRFLLKTEGFEILSERLTHPATEVQRFSWALKPETKPFLSELRLALRPVVARLRRLRLGEDKYNESQYSAYTCLAKGTGKLEIF